MLHCAGIFKSFQHLPKLMTIAPPAGCIHFSTSTQQNDHENTVTMPKRGFPSQDKHVHQIIITHFNHLFPHQGHILLRHMPTLLSWTIKTLCTTEAWHNGICSPRSFLQFPHCGTNKGVSYLFCLLPSQHAKVHTHGQSTLTRHVMTPQKWYQAKQGTRYQCLPPHHSPVRHRGCLLTSCQLHNRCLFVSHDHIMQFIKCPTYINAKWNKISINISQKATDKNAF